RKSELGLVKLPQGNHNPKVGGSNPSPATTFRDFQISVNLRRGSRVDGCYRGAAVCFRVAATRVRRACAASKLIRGEGLPAGCGGVPGKGRCIETIGIDNLKELSTSGIRVTTAARIADMGSPIGPGRSSGMAGVVTMTVRTSLTPLT